MQFVLHQVGGEGARQLEPGQCLALAIVDAALAAPARSELQMNRLFVAAEDLLAVPAAARDRRQVLRRGRRDIDIRDMAAHDVDPAGPVRAAAHHGEGSR